MHRPLRTAGLLAAIALLSLGCGQKSQPEMPEPVSQEAPSSESPSLPATVSSEPLSAKGLDQAERATLEERISFDFDQWDLTPAAREKLSAKAEVLREVANVSLRIEGHADERGSDEYNLVLSNRRAAAAMRFLVNQGIAQDRLEAVGYGEEQPLDSAENEAAWARNRRDDFRAISSGRLAQQ
jgi:peptidoglycan-associated lipoprotein